ncbi:MAG: bifunctional adenosylcobinamide kinase/adenosylcobinamide-phosphate guanylyltransferase [Actinobacteria bacterium]|nr:bifunctional adenosylcobinamide kinase/adenosylcobinamide-phosphate guanylyltransferase [Actinomycetota bacterium]
MTPQDRFIFVTGGARSGKSTFAERLAAQLAEPYGGRVTYLATSETNDVEMTARVTAHRAARPAAWTTVECPLEVPAAVREHASTAATSGSAASGGSAGPPVFLLDCVTFWVTNLLFAGGAFGGSAPPDEGFNYDKDLLPADEERAASARVSAGVGGLLAARAETGATLIAVSNEVGLGVVPEYPLARLYRDQLGWANQRLAAAADRVYFLVAGFPLDVTALAVSPLTQSPLKESDQ